LRYGTTPKEIIANAEEKLKDEDEVNETYLELLNGILKRAYIPSANGAEVWFRETENDSRLMTELGYDSPQYDIVTARAQQAFKQSGHDIKDIIDMAGRSPVES